MANVSPSRKSNREDLTTRRIRVFAQRYGEKALFLAYHAAFPLTITSDLLYCLRENFVPDCSWYTVADVLLSGLCQPAGYDLYEMEGKTRNRLLSRLCNEFGEQRLKELANFMSQYLVNRLQVEENDRALILGERPNWTALAYFGDGEQAINAIKEELQRLTNSADADERIKWAALVENYADLLAEKGFEPLLFKWAQDTVDNQPIQDDEETEIAELMGIELQPFEYEVAVIVTDDDSEEELKSFEFETVTVNAQGEVVKRELKQAFYFIEYLGEVEKNPKNDDFSNYEKLKALLEERKVILNRFKLTKSIAERAILQDKLEEINSQISQVEQEFNNLQSEQKETAPLGIEMVAIPGGTFEMGSPGGEFIYSFIQQHKVTISPFFMSTDLINQAQWRTVAALPKVNSDLKLEPSRFRGDKLPVEQVSWYDAVEFCARLSNHTGREYRLPSEAEWEYACRAGTTTPFYFGETITDKLANYNASTSFANEPLGESRKRTTPVGQFPPNAFGLYDMHGNLWEWCLDDWHSNYEDAPTDGSPWFDDNNNLSQKQGTACQRGGSWYSNPDFCRSAYRDYDAWYERVKSNYTAGFRIVCGVERIL
ncbi:MAG: SUMF1/EgtB/PvdO family nonheme iron enzyme [Cyanobacteria bacterium P01_D01_bin.50]